MQKGIEQWKPLNGMQRLFYITVTFDLSPEKPLYPISTVFHCLLYFQHAIPGRGWMLQVVVTVYKSKARHPMTFNEPIKAYSFNNGFMAAADMSCLCTRGGSQFYLEPF